MRRSIDDNRAEPQVVDRLDRDRRQAHRRARRPRRSSRPRSPTFVRRAAASRSSRATSARSRLACSSPTPRPIGSCHDALARPRSSLSALAACGGKMPETRYYQLATTAPAAQVTRQRRRRRSRSTPLDTDQAYDDERIVYRVTPYRLDYYNYHRWSAAPGMLVARLPRARVRAQRPVPHRRPRRRRGRAGHARWPRRRARRGRQVARPSGSAASSSS